MKKILILAALILAYCNTDQKKQNKDLPGRLGNKDLTVNEDKRINKNLLKAMIKAGLDGVPPSPTVNYMSTRQEIQDYNNNLEPKYQGVFEDIFSVVKLPEGLVNQTETIKGEDNNEIKLYITRPEIISGDLPGILHIHGGGMAIMTANDPNYIYWRHKLASTGLVVVGVEFRNTAGILGEHPFPAGLNDCISSLKWVYENKKKLGISKIIVSGESGGGNLSIATGLKAKEDGIIDYIDGIYAQCPYISNLYNKGENELKSLIENNAYFLRTDDLGLTASIYDGIESKNPLAWPYYANKIQLQGLPPHVITVNELDPLRDEGIIFSEKLKHAGVNVRMKIIKGTVHAAENIFPLDIPIIHNQAIEDIKNFSYNLK
ncbi:alpha/beta hydrolase [Flavobacteriaceae bacterium]|nr:alpha/beta hydrolase [Flavobacteriaceae bacterium]